MRGTVSLGANSGSRWSQSGQRSLVKRLAWVRSKGLLACRKGDCTQGWRTQSDNNRPGQYRSRRLGNRAMRGGVSAKEALFLRHERRNSTMHWSRGELFPCHLLLGSGRPSAAYKYLVRHDDHCARNGAIHVRKVLDVDVVQARVVAVGRDIRLMRAKRKPAHTSSASRTGVPSSTADKCHEGRRVDRVSDALPRHPDPDSAATGPAAIVERCKSPWSVVDPGPTPGIDPVPVPEMVRRPP